MAPGRTHSKVAWNVLWASGILTTAGLYTLTANEALQLTPKLLTGVIGFHTGLYVGIYVTPDLDVDAGNISHAKMRRRYGKVGEWLWKAYWHSYARAHSHRGRSHEIFWGTAGRWKYVLQRGGFLALVMLLGALWWSGQLPTLWPYVLIFSFSAFCGQAIQDVGHALFDL